MSHVPTQDSAVRTPFNRKCHRTPNWKERLQHTGNKQSPIPNTRGLQGHRGLLHSKTRTGARSQAAHRGDPVPSVEPCSCRAWGQALAPYPAPPILTLPHCLLHSQKTSCLW